MAALADILPGGQQGHGNRRLVIPTPGGRRSLMQRKTPQEPPEKPPAAEVRHDEPRHGDRLAGQCEAPAWLGPWSSRRCSKSGEPSALDTAVHFFDFDEFSQGTEEPPASSHASLMSGTLATRTTSWGLPGVTSRSTSWPHATEGRCDAEDEIPDENWSSGESPALCTAVHVNAFDEFYHGTEEPPASSPPNWMSVALSPQTTSWGLSNPSAYRLISRSTSWPHATECRCDTEDEIPDENWSSDESPALCTAVHVDDFDEFSYGAEEPPASPHASRMSGTLSPQTTSWGFSNGITSRLTSRAASWPHATDGRCDAEYGIPEESSAPWLDPWHSPRLSKSGETSVSAAAVHLDAFHEFSHRTEEPPASPPASWMSGTLSPRTTSSGLSSGIASRLTSRAGSWPHATDGRCEEQDGIPDEKCLASVHDQPRSIDSVLDVLPMRATTLRSGHSDAQSASRRRAATLESVTEVPKHLCCNTYFDSGAFEDGRPRPTSGVHALDAEEDAWIKRLRINGVVGRMVEYTSSTANIRPSDDIPGLRMTRSGRVVVLAVAENGPAEEAGVRPGDQLVSINGRRDFRRPVDMLLQCLQPPTTLIFVGFVGVLQADVRVERSKWMDEPPGLPLKAGVLPREAAAPRVVKDPTVRSI